MSSQGSTLTPTERLAVKNSILKLQLNESLNVKFWGKIYTQQIDYLVLKAVALTDSIDNAFFFSCNGGATFAKLPAVDEWITTKAAKVRGQFTGNPGQKYKDPDTVRPVDDDEYDNYEEEEEYDEDSEGKQDPSKRKLTEVERLAYAVSLIDGQTCLVPRGYLVQTSTGLITRNKNFEGLCYDKAGSLDSFCLLRAPQSDTTKAQIRKAGLVDNPNFLDVVGTGALTEKCHFSSEDKKKLLTTPAAAGQKAWVLRRSEDGRSVSLRSLEFPGFEYRLSVGSAHEFSGAYFGWAEQNRDLLFML